MSSFKQVKSISSWLVFAIALVVFYMSAERTGSLWDCGEFILGAYKLQVVHPPGAPLFMLIGRMFTWVAEIFSSNPADIAFAVNLMSGVCTAFTAFFVARITMLLGKRTFSDDIQDTPNYLPLGFAGLVAGLATAFCSSIWFSAVEGEVYAMSTMFTALTFWAATKWYVGPDAVKTDRWLLAVAFLGGLSIGVHLLSLLTFPAIGLMYYYKKYKEHNILGAFASIAAGAAVIVFIQKVVIVGIVEMWANFDIALVNGAGLPFNSGLVVALLLIGIVYFFLFRATTQQAGNARTSLIIASVCFALIALLGWGISVRNLVWTILFAGGALYLANNYSNTARYNLQMFTLASLFTMIGFSTIGVIVLRAQADTPVNMNVPSDATRLLPYLNREQYGERALLHGPHFDARPKDIAREARYGKVGDKYEIVTEKFDYVYDKKDKMFFPRVGHTELNRPQLHRVWYSNLMGKKFRGKPSMAYNIKYMAKYQMGWMYWRYFFWNFIGRQNGEQGYYYWDKSAGHWISGIKFIDEMRLHNMDQLSDTMINDPYTNKYYFLPLIFGLIGMFFHFRKHPKDFSALLMLFLMTGLGIIMYSNQPPNEPRERDYVLVGSFFTFCMWMGLSVPALVGALRSKLSLSTSGLAVGAGLIALSAPLIMGFQNFDDHSRKDHYGSRDYAANFLESCQPNAIIFTYGDNDTYPLWYAQEVENIRRDVRVVNLSLIAVDWYIEKLRNKVNDSDPIKLSIPPEAYLGDNRNQVFFMNRATDEQRPVNVLEELKFVADDRTKQGPPGEEQSVTRSRRYILPIDAQRMIRSGLVSNIDSTEISNKIEFYMGDGTYYTKDDLAVVDIIANNIYDRPIYFAVTCKEDKLLRLNDHLQMEGLGLRVMPIDVPSLTELQIFGSGKVDTDIAYDNIMNKWKWGNFDKIDTHISTSYGAELQAMKVVMMRTAEELLQQGDIERAANMSQKYFDAFPHFNFPYDDSVTPFIRLLTAAGRKDEAKKHLSILAEETFQNLIFYESVDETSFRNSYERDYGFSVRAVNSILEEARRIGDQDLVKELNDKLGQYDLSRLQNQLKK